MKTIFFFGMVFIYPIVCLSLAFGWADWRVLRSEHFDLFYKPGYRKEAEAYLRVLEAYREDVVHLTGHDIGRLRVVIEDLGQVSSGFADPLNPNVHLFTYPPSLVWPVENWRRLVGVHEMTHIAHLTKTGGIPKIYTTLFGNIFSPNLWVPRWIGEGIAVYAESQPSPYEGRLNDGFFNSVMAAVANERRFPSLLDITYTPLDFPTLAGGPYLYGGKFLSHLKEKYGEERFREFFKHQGSSMSSLTLGPIFPYFGIDWAAQKTYGKDFGELWQEWRAEEVERASGFRIDGSPITSRRLAFYLYLTCKGDYLYYVRVEAKKTGAYSTFWGMDIIERNLVTSKERSLVSTPSFFTCPPRVRTGSLYYTVADIKPGYANSILLGYGVLSNLHKMDLLTGRDEVLLREEVRAFEVLEDGGILFSRDKRGRFGSEVWHYPPSRGEKRLILRTDYLVGQIVEGEGRIVFVARRDWENWGIYLFDLEKKTITPIVNTPYIESFPQVFQDKVIFVANYDGVYRVYAYCFETEKIVILTNGAFSHFPVVDERGERLYFVGIGSEGTNIYVKKLDLTKEIRIKDYQVDSTHKVVLDSDLEFREGSYLCVLKTLFPPAFRFPILLPDRIGVLALGYDVTYEHEYLILGGIESEGRPWVNLWYRSCFFSPITSGVAFKTSEAKEEVRLFGSYPVYQRLEAGLSLFQLGVEAGFGGEGGSEIRELVPNVTLSFRYPRLSIEGRLDYLVEKKWFGGERDRDGVRLTMEVSGYLPMGHPERGSQFTCLLKAIHDPKASIGERLEIRGYGDVPYVKRGGSITLEYETPILKVRKGLWNPNVYLEDLSLALFTDLVLEEGMAPRVCVGGELRFEAASAFYVTCIPIIGLSLNKEGKFRLYFDLAF